jgi:hypothetical protein
MRAVTIPSRDSLFDDPMQRSPSTIAAIETSSIELL